MTLLERMEKTRNRLVGRSHYNYTSWRSCTCGHIYKTAKHHRGTEYTVKYSNDSTYRDMLLAIANANGGNFSSSESTRGLTQFVSSATASYASANGVRARDAAICLIDKAIAAEKAACEQARLDVLAQAQNVIDSADVRETEKV